MSTDVEQTQPAAGSQPEPPQAPPARRPGELGIREMGRWSWRQLTSMRTALVLLLLLALAAVPGSVVPQDSVDSLAASRWRDSHTTLAPIYERLGLFSVYDSPWFSAIYLLLVVSLIGCIVPRTFVYWRGLRAKPPAAPRNLARLPEHAAYRVSASPHTVLEDARRELRRRRYRVRVDDDAGPEGGWVAAERGYLREAGNLLFHVSVIVVMVGFGLGGLFGYQGGVIVIQGTGFANNLSQYDDFNPGSLFDPTDMEPFSFTLDEFSAEWIESGAGRGMARGFQAGLTYQESPDAETEQYDLRVNHPLSIGDTDVFLIGHGYAPVITVRDTEGEVMYSQPVVFLPQDQGLLSYGVAKSTLSEPDVGLEGLFYPTYVMIDGDPVNVMGDDRNPTLSMEVFAGDLGLDDGSPQSIYVLDKDGAPKVTEEDGSRYRLDLQPGQTADLPDDLGSVTFEGVEPWTRVQISQTPGKEIALAGVVLALIGLLGSLFIRPRRIWVRARKADQGGGSMVEVAVLRRSSAGPEPDDEDAGPDELDKLVAALGGPADGTARGAGRAGRAGEDES
ncbi:cytochrome c biogenesis protein ResB [Nocardioides sp. AX2bis]|uniref:cytochrome c biogenesis protein ResB n=1 Tax=Nocardioides sp. AX2bis TaxID=2653157 RepID=UPI0012F1AC87|nr:cytochrome c biogenesis protein ResB [Nocardioides sp. AX2bis]VXC20771.1 putative Ccs1/ResB-related cytochrome C-type biogenesis protein [Nocardioides sp. AX2bis]